MHLFSDLLLVVDYRCRAEAALLMFRSDQVISRDATRNIDRGGHGDHGSLLLLGGLCITETLCHYLLQLVTESTAGVGSDRDPGYLGGLLLLDGEPRLLSRRLLPLLSVIHGFAKGIIGDVGSGVRDNVLRGYDAIYLDRVVLRPIDTLGAVRGTLIRAFVARLVVEQLTRGQISAGR